MAIAGAVLLWCAVPSMAQAQQPAGDPDTGWYVGVGGGPQVRADAKDLIGAATVFKTGFDLGASIGYRWEDVRVEGEMLYINNNNAREIVTGAFDEEGRGNVGLRAVMANVYYDIGNSAKWRPYVGAGVGFFQSQVHGLTSKTLSAGVPGFFGPTVVDTSSPETPAWNFKIGLSYRANKQTHLYIGYRYFHGSDFHLDSATLGALDVNGAKVNALEVGFRAGF